MPSQDPVPAPASTWPRPVQLALVFALGVGTGLLLFACCRSWTAKSRPTELEDLSYRIDLNRADPSELLQIPGVGDQLAARIQRYRSEHGSFRAVDDLKQVHGVGPEMLARLRPWVKVRGQSPGGDSGASVESPSGKDRSVRQPVPMKGQLRQPIDINHASVEDLQRLPGIGPKMAERIVQAREIRPFQSVNDLRRVSGIGPKRLEQIRPYVRVGSAELLVIGPK